MSTVVPTLRVVLPDPTDYIHAHALDEVAFALLGGLKRLGVDVEVTRTCTQGRARVLVLAPHLQSLDDLRALDHDAILYTWEPRGWTHVAFMTPELVSLMRDYVIWDYSGHNIATWRAEGARRLLHVPLGYDPVLERIPPREAPQVDVLFYGGVNDRRRTVLDEISAQGLRVLALFGVYGTERDFWIARSRLVLNMHVHEGQILELPRLAYLWANRVPVVAEFNPETEDMVGMAGHMVTAGYADLATAVVEAVADPARMEKAATDCYREFRGRAWMRDVLRKALSDSDGWAS